MAGSAQVPIFLAAGLAPLVTGLVSGLGPAPALGQRSAIDHAREYQDCMVLARAAPKDGFESARAEGTLIADSARANLEKLDVKVE